MNAIRLLAFFTAVCGMSMQAQEPSFLNPDEFLTPSSMRNVPVSPSQSSEGTVPRPVQKPVRVVPRASEDAPIAEEVAEEIEPVAQEVAEDTPPSPQTVAGSLVSRDKTQVAVLGYHNFSDTKPVTEMCMRTSDFRRQMEYLRLAGITVIGMQDFLDWRFGTKQLPEKCVLITIDDGWRSTYTDAYPILKEMGYPFTLFPYTKYITGKGDAMSRAMVQEMIDHGATLGSHSTSHYYPSTWKHAGQGTPAYSAMIEKEIGDSAKQLSAWFGKKVITYCYPGGYHTPEMIEKLPQYGYLAAFTVIPKKVRYDEDPYLIHRYMIFGNDHRIFQRAVNFSATSENTGANDNANVRISATAIPPFEVTPAALSTVPSLVPMICADLSNVPGLQNASVQMYVSGFGKVACKVDVAKKMVSWQPPVRFHMPVVTVKLRWKTAGTTAEQTAVWSFKTNNTVEISTPAPTE